MATFVTSFIVMFLLLFQVIELIGNWINSLSIQYMPAYPTQNITHLPISGSQTYNFCETIKWPMMMAIAIHSMGIELPTWGNCCL